MTTKQVEWPVVPLDQIADVRLGRQRTPKDHSGENLRPYLRAANVGWRGLRLDDVKTMNFSDREAEIFSLRAGDIVVGEASGSVSEVGKPAIWSGELAECYFQNTLVRVRSHGINPEYLLYFLRYEARRGAFARHARGVGIHHIGAARLASWPVPVPPVQDQKSIAEALHDAETAVNSIEDRFRAIIEQCERAVDLIIFESLIGVPDESFDRRASAKDTEILPDGWAWRELQDIGDIVSGVTKDSKRQADQSLPAVPYLRVANVQRNRLDLREVSEIRISAERAEKLALQPGDVLMTEGGDRDKLGRGWIWEDQIPGCIHQNHVFRVRLDKAALDPRILSWYGNTYGRTWFERNGKQSTNLASISMRMLRQLPVPIPPVDAQPRLVETIQGQIGSLDRIRDRVETELRNLDELRVLAAARLLSAPATTNAGSVD